MLAPGNIPALAAELPCEFVFLTSSEDAEILREHPACRYLRSICEVDIRVIDDLITGDNHSTTITLAYARAVRAAGDAMRRHLLLLPDFRLPDGGRFAGQRFSIGSWREPAASWPAISRSSRKMPTRSFHATIRSGLVRKSCCAPRELMKWALRHLHPVTAGNIGEFPAVPAAPGEPAVLAGRRKYVARPILSDAHDLHPARGQRISSSARPATTPSFRRCATSARSR